jgi:RNA-directed DNA polymerase
VRRVTERNAGRLTAGVDGEVVLTPEAKARLVDRIQHRAEPFNAMPVRRVCIPKRGSSTKRRPLGIPVILDRCHQARVVNALEPEWEARFEPRSYGFRPGRGCHDAIEAISHAANGKDPKRRWALDADLAGAFDIVPWDLTLKAVARHTDQRWILLYVERWLKAPLQTEDGSLVERDRGTPQGSAISPLLARACPGHIRGAGDQSAQQAARLLG